MSKTIERVDKFLDEQYGDERFDVPVRIAQDVIQIGKGLVTLGKKGKKMEAKKFTSSLRDFYDELYEYIKDMEDYRYFG